jgi:23S rRNA (cytidine1920-2'-O)/16S rRNA (cytidine1409-2'-O)-methyltransferase
LLVAKPKEQHETLGNCSFLKGQPALRVRIDRLLVERGMFDSRAKAQAAVAAGRVSANAAIVTKPSEQVAADALLSAEPEHPWVSRGGIKLAAALDHFQLDPRDRVCLDVGASAGGFSEVLLARGARRVYAVDVGRGQLHPRLRRSARIISLEQTDVRKLKNNDWAELPDFVCIDVSFVSLKLVLPAAVALLRFPAHLLALIKPQFEAGRRAVKKGIVRDGRIHDEVCADISAFLRSRGWEVAGLIPSPIAGGDGNREFLIGAAHE